MPIIPIIGILAVCVGFALLYRQRNIHNERVILEYRLEEIHKRCTSDDTLTRVIAITQLLDMALRHAPGRSSTITARNYPFFEPATIQMTIMLRMSVEQSETKALAGALFTMIQFTRKDKDPALKNFIGKELFFAGWMSKTELINAMASYWFYQEERQNQNIVEAMNKLLLPYLRRRKSSLKEETTRREFIARLCESEEFKQQMLALSEEMREKTGISEQITSEAELLDRLEKSAKQYLVVDEMATYASKGWSGPLPVGPYA